MFTICFTCRRVFCDEEDCKAPYCHRTCQEAKRLHQAHEQIRQFDFCRVCRLHTLCQFEKQFVSPTRRIRIEGEPNDSEDHRQ